MYTFETTFFSVCSICLSFSMQTHDISICSRLSAILGRGADWRVSGWGEFTHALGLCSTPGFTQKSSRLVGEEKKYIPNSCANEVFFTYLF